MFLGVGWQTDPHIWRQGETEKRGKTTTYWKVSLLIHKGIYMGGLSWMVIRQADLYLFMSENLRSYRGLSWVHSHIQSRWSQQHFIISSLHPWKHLHLWGWCCLVAQLCLTLQPHDYSKPGFPVLHHLPELAQNHFHWVGDAIQPSCPLWSPSPPALYFSQRQSFPFFFFKWP